MTAAEVFKLFRDAYNGWSNDEASRLAAALAFYTIFAIAPLLIIVIDIAAVLLGGGGHDNTVRDQILNQLRPAIGDSGTKAISDLVQATFNQHSKGVIATTVAWVLFVVAATGLIVAIQGSLDTIWHVKRSGGIYQTIVDRAKSFAIIAGAALLVVAIGFATAIVSMIGSGLAGKIGNAFLNLVVVTVITAALYKWLPKVDLSWRDVWVGAAISAVLTVAGQYLIGIYLGRTATTSAYGAAGSLVAILLWLYYSAQIFLFGAEITKAFANRFGSQKKGTASVERGTVETPLPA